ncbi:HPr(Ser) kinase/phosphatase [Candidatus Neptunochlamydia vexilliferae]|nr:HPr(Ser) kinase/phosphatase [Candidatus Neptunochlamydia vexilliferae]
MKLAIQEFYETHGASLGLETIRVGQGVEREIKVSHVQRPGLSLAGYMKRKSDKRILIFGRMELSYLCDLDPELRLKRLKGVITSETPAVIVARALPPPRELSKVCQELKVPLFRTEVHSMPLLTELTMLLSDYFAPTDSLHGTLVEAYGVGVLIQGESSVGKSEAALGLIERGHRLISNDVVILRKRNSHLVGLAPELNKHLLELRGIGIINVAHLFGAVCVRSEVQVDLVIRLEEWNEKEYYDRVGLEERFTEILGLRVPLIVQPVKPGRDSVLLIETALLNHRLKEMGYHSAREFNDKLLETIARKKKIGTRV